MASGRHCCVLAVGASWCLLQERERHFLSLALQAGLGAGESGLALQGLGAGRDCTWEGWVPLTCRNKGHCFRCLILSATASLGSAKGKAAQAGASLAFTVENIFILVNYCSEAWPCIHKWQDVSWASPETLAFPFGWWDHSSYMEYRLERLEKDHSLEGLQGILQVLVGWSRVGQKFRKGFEKTWQSVFILQ